MFGPARSARRSAVILPLLLLAACEPGVLDPAGPVASGERLILFDSLAIMLLIVIPVIVLALGFAWWFRAGNAQAVYRPRWAYSGRLELLVWSIPLLVVVFIAGIGWISSHELDPPKPLASRVPAIRVEVVAMDWKWLFIYPDLGIASVNRLVVPVGTPIAFRLTSATVMNSFFVPRLGSQIYAMSGMETKLNLQADRPGRYRGLSAHYSGKGFADMIFAVDAVTAPAFAQWVAGARAAGPGLDGHSYLALAEPSEHVAPFTFRTVKPHLFEAAMMQAGMTPPRPVKDGRQR